MEFSLRPMGFMGFLQNNNYQAVSKMKWIENRNIVKNRWDFDGIFTYVCVCACMCVCVCVCEYACVRICVSVWVIVAYYRVCMGEWYIVHVYMKVQAQSVVFTGC